MERTNRIHSVLGADEHTIVLTDYQKKRTSRLDWYSPPYFTHSQGYKMGVYVNLFYSDHLLVCSYLFRGQYDAGLKWPFRGTVVVQLLNQVSDDNHYDYVFDYSRASDRESQRVTSGERSGYKSSSTPYLTLAALESTLSKKCQYLRDDCLKFRVYVKNL